MMGILRSPRKRKRLAYTIVVPLVLAGLVFAGATMLPKAQEDPPEVFSNKQAYNIAYRLKMRDGSYRTLISSVGRE